MIVLHKPDLEELWFKQVMLADAETMSYNHAYGGTIAFPPQCWEAWYKRWIIHHENRRFYRYIKQNETFVGEIAYHFDEQLQLYLADVIVFAPYRTKGYGRTALQLLCDAAREQGIRQLYDNIALDNPAISLFLSCGFREVFRTEEFILVEKNLGE